MLPTLNTSLCVKDRELYVFVFDEQNRENAAKQIAQFASDSQLSLSWFDAATMIRQIHEQTPNSLPKG